MNWLRWVGVWVVIGLTIGSNFSNAEEDVEEQAKAETVVIPLDQIWAQDIPGTRDFRELLVEPLLEKERLVCSVASKSGKSLKAGFAVRGKGLEALRQVRPVLVEKEKPQQTFLEDTEISVFFFSHQATSYVHLHRVERIGNVINIRYRFVPHDSENMSGHSALIPLGKLPSGKYRVNVIQSPMEQKYVDWGFRPISEEIARRIVCHSFSFVVE